MECKTPLYDLPSNAWNYAFGVLFGVISVFGAVENCLVLLTLYKFKPLHRMSNRILSSLATSDFLASSILAPVFVAQLLKEELSTHCRLEMLRRFLSTFFIGASVFTLGLISYDRCLHLTKLQDYNMTIRKSNIFIFFCWFIPFLIPFLKVVGETESLYYAAVIILLVISLTVMSGCYILIIWALHKHGKLQTDKIMTKKSKGRRLRAGRTVVIILSCFMLMVLPVNVHLMTSILDKNKSRSEVAVGYIIQMALCLLNSVVNPIIYYFRTPNLKLCLKKLVGIRPRDNTWEEGSQIHYKSTKIRTTTEL